MRTVLFNSAVIMGVVWMGTAPADAAPPSMSGIGNTSIQVATGERVGYRRYYRRHGYPVPYAYYPPPYATMCHRPRTPTPLRTSITLGLLLRTATTATLRQTAIMATLRLLKETTPTLRRTAIMATLRPRKVTNRRQESALAVNVCFWHLADFIKHPSHTSAIGGKADIPPFHRCIIGPSFCFRLCPKL